ncbi:hypothetical protein Tdes44962_MAKER02837 [Teratosphaeria destructans]|uniref:Uncharacterized protein n=1 Tax=Teratosphaeria destructans TaxID=418781 RepID=A0A9W7SS29_9PEZI|nr:hypothetical protein Tdes44962_MAKER02837 [Teratosphaeria destructans]
MAGTRSSARLASSPSSQKSAATPQGTKRKADEPSPPNSKSKRGRPSKASKEQKTIEETLTEGNGDSTKEVEPNEQPEAGANDNQTEMSINGTNDETNDEARAGDDTAGENGNAFDDVKASENEPGKTTKEEEPKQAADSATNGKASESAIEEDKKREESQPTNVMEKGCIYFFTRGRVGVTEPESPQDLQRSFFVLRPLPAGAKITHGTIQDDGKNRLIALPKKVWPKSGRDRFMCFVEKAGVTVDTLKEEFMQGSDYSTKTTGTRHTPGVEIIGEGVYAITWTGSGRTTNHLSYKLTIPQEIGELQKDVGLDRQGSFVISTKNPKQSGQNNPGLSVGAEYPKDVQEEFGTLGWLPTTPVHLDYANGQILLIGESSGLDAVEPTQKDAKHSSKETPVEELEKLEHEDDLRVEHLQGDSTVYLDLDVSGKDYPVKSTWG